MAIWEECGRIGHYTHCEEHDLKQGWPISTHKMTHNSLAHLTAALVYRYIEWGGGGIELNKGRTKVCVVLQVMSYSS